MDYMTTQEAAVKWNVSPRSVTRYIKAGKIPGAVQKGKSWLIPQAADRPRDGRDRKRAGMNILPTRFEKKMIASGLQKLLPDIFSGTELHLLYGVAMGYTNLQLAEYHQVTASTISKRLNIIYEKAGIKKRSEVRDYVLRLTRGIYTVN